MSIGILIHNMILLLICLIFFRTVPVIAGVLIGAAAAEVCLLWKFTTINLLAVVLGALGLKTGAYVYPVLQKRTDRKA